MSGSPTINPIDGLPIIAAGALPPEARATLMLIDAGGPYPYRQDGTTYQNRERLLPARSPDHYREFTVATPASADRGPRRIVIGADGERYWSVDHYASFARIVP